MMPFRNNIYHRCARDGSTERRRGGHRCTHLSGKSAPEGGGGARRRTRQRNNSADVTRQGTSSSRNATTACDATLTTNV
eukprot:scaffold158_cov103-Skeletonema_dohrnii-CCMP3373.AAC.7